MSTIVREPAGATVPPADLVPVPYLPRSLPFDDPGWVFQPKYEGLRSFAVRTRGGCEIPGASDFRHERLQELAERIALVLGDHEAVLDGEVVALDRGGRPSLRELLRGRSLPAFSAFDLLWVDGEDLRALPFLQRRRRLAELVPTDTGPLYKAFLLEEHGRALFQAARRLELEGIVARRGQDPYGPGTVWYGIRNPSYTQDDGRIDPFRGRNRSRRPDREPAGA